MNILNLIIADSAYIYLMIYYGFICPLIYSNGPDSMSWLFK